VNRINAVILDWAGTTVDYGCFAPVNAFISAFDAFGIKVGIEETRAPMGLAKRRHIEIMLENLGHSYAQEDVTQIYESFEQALFEALESYTDPLPGVLETVECIRKMGIAIGSTTGYTKAMMDVVMPAAKKKGYAPDCLVCPEETDGIGRPEPYMLWRNLEKLRVPFIQGTLKVGDTIADIKEGKNAGVLSVGVLKGSSMLGLSEKELEEKDSNELLDLLNAVAKKYTEAGADYVIEDISALPSLIERLNHV
jgi:phosphonoacetaldehyde hydrolase